MARLSTSSIMKNIALFLLLFSNQYCFLAYGQGSIKTANDYVRPYTESFQYGSNIGYYGTSWTDEGLAGLVQNVNGHTIRPALPEAFLEKYGYDIRTGTFDTYINKLGMKEITCFVQEPSSAHRDLTVYPGCKGPSKLFAHLYEPIWDDDGSVNANNYYANYIYNLVLNYGDKVRFWEVINEPDYSYLSNKDLWLTRAPQPSELTNIQAPLYHYIRMIRITYEVVKKYHPEAYVTTGGVGYTQFVDALLRYTDNPKDGTVTAQYPKAGGAYMDAFSFHSYPSFSLHKWDNSISGFRYTRTSDYAASKVMEDRQAMVDVLASYGYNGSKYPVKHMLVSETNVGRRTSGDRTGSDEMQRNFGIKTLILAQKNSIKQLYFFNLGETANAPAAGQSVAAADEMSFMGLYQNLKRDLPGLQKVTQLGRGLSTTSKVLYGFSYDPARTAALALPSNIEGAAFSKNGTYAYVLWAKALVDNSENASATYSFPLDWKIESVKRYEWNYATTAAFATQNSKDIKLSGTPSFFTELPKEVVTSPIPTGNCEGTGTLVREEWDNVLGNTLSKIPLTLPFSNSQVLTKFEISTKNEFNYAARLRGFICPPQSGAYTFWIAGDDAAELLLSTDDDPTHKVRIATCTKWTSSAHDWFRYPSQQSAPVQLLTGHRYYIEATHKQEWGKGYVSVAWQLPNGARQMPIPGSSLIPFPVTADDDDSSTDAGSNAAKTKTSITFTFATPPTNASVRFAPTLYNKPRVLQFEQDDSPASIFTDVYPLFKGGVASNGKSYPGLRYTDGCGHSVAYTAAVAINGHNPFNNSVWLDDGPSHDSNKLFWSQAQELLDNGWDIENHSDLHTAPNPAKQVANLDALISDRLQGYKPSVLIVPTDYAGYCKTAFSSSYVAASSAGQSDDLPMFNEFSSARLSVSSLPSPTTPFVYRRYNADKDESIDETNETQLMRLKALTDNLMSPSSTADDTEVYLQRVFCHGIDFNTLASWMKYTQTIAQDQLWVTTLREFAEYRRVSSQVVKKETLNGSTLTVDLDYSGLSPNTLFQNLTLLVDSPGKITNITVSGGDSSSFNMATKMVNVFRHQSYSTSRPLQLASAKKTNSASASEKLNVNAADKESESNGLSIYPNPFTKQTTIKFSVTKGGPVSLSLYNLQGQLVRQLLAKSIDSGTSDSITLDADGLAAGIYIVRFVNNMQVISKKIICSK
jgi:hypothetical protein